MSIIRSSMITTMQNTLMITQTTSMLAISMSMHTITVNMLLDNDHAHRNDHRNRDRACQNNDHAEEHPGDVFLLMKQWMRDRHLSQPPLLVFPGFWKADAIAWLAKAAPGGAPMVEEMKIKDKRRREYKALQTYLEGRAPVKERGVAYMKYLAALGKTPPMPLPIAWLRNVQPLLYQQGLEDSEGPEPFAPHMMSVVHKRPCPQ